jgi:hypothetical protein
MFLAEIKNTIYMGYTTERCASGTYFVAKLAENA